MKIKPALSLLGITIAAAYLCACAGYRPHIQVPKKMPEAAPLASTPRVAVVLGGGGAKGFAHLGVLSVLEKAGVPIDMVSSSSAGSVVGALYTDRGSAAEAKKALMHATFWDIADIGNFPSVRGVISGYRLEKFLLAHMHAKNFKQTKVKFIVSTTDLRRGTEFPIQSGPIAPAVLASGAMPGAVRPVKIYGRTLVDGCMVDPVPVNLVQPYHPKVIIAVNIDQQLAKKMPWSFYGFYKRGFNISWLTLAHYTEAPADVIIRPAVGQVGTFDFSQKQNMYNAGAKAARKALPKILALLKARHIALLKRALS